MEGEKKVTIDGVIVKCMGYYDYNNHYYVSVFLDENCQYVGEIFDCRVSEESFRNRLKKFLVEKGVFALTS